PTGIATDATTSKFFSDLVESGNLKSITGFKNERFIFTGIEHVVTFCIVVIGGEELKFDEMKFSWLAYTFADANDVTRQIILKPSDFSLLNPNTFTCPIFRTAADAELTRKIYQNVPVLENENTGINPWGISFMRMFDMANDSGLFHTQDPQQDPGLLEEVRDLKLPLYEAKMFHQFDHRYSTYDNATQAQLNVGILPKPEDELKEDPYFEIKPRYWVDKKEVENRLS
ncbi:MAG: restriction endonuclease, partial [Sphaerospermopsis kisseleviana]